VRRAVPLDERVGQLPLGPNDLEAVALEHARRRTEAAKLLPGKDEASDSGLDRLHGPGRGRAPETDAHGLPQSRPRHGDGSIGSAVLGPEPPNEQAGWGGNEVG
jgi:hypothetical protein